MNKKPAIQAENLTVTFEDRSVLKSADFVIEEGEFVFIVGSNGSGKSTLIKAILGLVEIDSGSVKIFGEKNTQKKLSTHVGYVPQHAKLDRDFPITVEEIITLECESGDKCHTDIGEHFGFFKAGHLLKRKIDELSGGEMQKVLISRGLVRDPDIIVLDEPTNNLDTESLKAFFELLKDLHKKGKTIIFISHDLSLVSKLATKVLYLYDHEVIFGDKEEILKKYKNIFSENGHH